MATVGFEINRILDGGEMITKEDCMEDSVVIISERVFSDFDDIARNLASEYPTVIRGVGEADDWLASAYFKALMIHEWDVDVYHESDARQAKILIEKCPNTTIVIR